MKKNQKILQEALISNNVLSAEDIQQYSESAQRANELLREHLVRNNILTEKQILIALSQKCDLTTVDLTKTKIDSSVIEKVSGKIAWYYRFIPIKLNGNSLTIAAIEPFDIKIKDEIRTYLGFKVEMILTTEYELHEALKKYYGFASDTIDHIMMKEPVSPIVSASDSGQWIEDLERKSEDPTVAHLVNEIILEAYKKRATDIHIEPYRDKVRFRYRIDGKLVDANLSANVKHFLLPILSRIKILANLSITEKRLPQDGSAVVKTKEQNLDLRISTMPTPRGESMVIRILPTKVMLFSLEKLGFNRASVGKFRELIKKPHGIIFMTGPTGSGKTTTLYACLNEISSSERKIITIEDPVEYEMNGITQVQVNSKVNFNFATGLRSILRHDPDIIMVGEVRDLETAEIAIRTALTGHLVFSTLHTNDAASGITRLVDMGVESYLVASSVEAFVAQRLVRIICPKCKEIDEEPPMGIKEEIAQALNLSEPEKLKIFKGTGCDHCNQTGFYGRMAIYEILTLNDKIRAAILEKPRSDYIKQVSMQEGLVTLRQNGWQAVLDGITTPGEVMNVTVRDKQVLPVNIPSDRAEEVTEAKISDDVKKEVSSPLKRSESWLSKNQYDSRIYPRCFDPIKIRYRLVKRDLQNPNQLFSDGIDHPTITEDISARGLRFISKEVIPIGSILELQIQLEEGKKSIECLAKVCRVEEDSFKNVYSIANYFLDVSSVDRTTINAFVEKRLKNEHKVDVSNT